MRLYGRVLPAPFGAARAHLHFSYFSIIPGTLETSILSTAVKRLLVILLVALAAPAAAVAAVAAPHDKTDGTLAVKDARGMIVIQARGTVLGRIDRGAVTITDMNPFDTNQPQVVGAESIQPDPTNTSATIYSGAGIRFRFVGAAYKITLVGRGIDIAAVGQGKVRFPVTGTANDGQFSLDGGPFQDVPALPFTGSFGGAAPVGG